MVLLVTFPKGLGTHNQHANEAVFPFVSPLGTFRRRDSLTVLGTLTKGNDDGSENVGKKMNLCSFKLNRVYLKPLNMSNAGDFSWSWILKGFIQVQKEEGKFVVVCPRLP